MAQLAYGFKERPDVRYGLTALCIGMGMGAALLWEAVKPPVRVSGPGEGGPGDREVPRREPTMPVTEFKLTRAGDVALVTIDNGEDWTKPTFFGQQALESLERLLDELENGRLSGGGRHGQAVRLCCRRRHHRVPGDHAGTRPRRLAGRTRALRQASCAPISDGRCDQRRLPRRWCRAGTALHRAHDLDRCPPLRLSGGVFGLFPAWGGTQLLPRLAGPATAIKVIVSNPLRQNRMLTGPQVVELGIADRLLEPADSSTSRWRSRASWPSNRSSAPSPTGPRPRRSSDAHARRSTTRSTGLLQRPMRRST